MDITKTQMIGQGNTAEIYRLEENKILKLFRKGLPKGIIEKEYHNGIIIQTILDCVPKVYEMVEINGRYGIIYEEIHGKDLLKIISGSLWKLNKHGKELAHYHLSIQKPVEDNLSTVKEKLEEEVLSVDLLSDENKKIIQAYLRDLPDGNALCHFDFHPGNVMIADSKKVVLDWMTACKGDACADVARTCLLLKHGEVTHAPWIIRMIVPFMQHYIYKLYRKEYLTISHCKWQEIECWELPVAAARLREWIPEKEKQVLLQLVNKRCSEIAR